MEKFPKINKRTPMFITESRVCTQRMQLYKGYEPIVWFGAWLHFTAYPCLIFTGLAQHGGFYHHFILFIQKKSRNHLNFDALKRIAKKSFRIGIPYLLFIYNQEFKKTMVRVRRKF